MTTERVTPEKVAEWEALAAGATEGPWVADQISREWIVFAQEYDAEEGGFLASLSLDDGKPDAAFIAASRTAVPQLCAALREAWQEIERLTLDMADVHPDDSDSANEEA